MKKIVFIFVGLAVVIILIRLSITDIQTYSTMGGAAIGFLGALFVYQIGSYIDQQEDKKINLENTLHVYRLYKDELDMNALHIKHLIEKRWIHFYKLKSVTRNSLWGQLANYSKNTALMKMLNYIYGEFELINNKFEIMNAARLAQISALKKEDKEAYQNEIDSQWSEPH